VVHSRWLLSTKGATLPPVRQLTPVSLRSRAGSYRLHLVARAAAENLAEEPEDRLASEPHNRTHLGKQKHLLSRKCSHSRLHPAAIVKELPGGFYERQVRIKRAIEISRVVPPRTTHNCHGGGIPQGAADWNTGSAEKSIYVVTESHLGPDVVLAKEAPVYRAAKPGGRWGQIMLHGGISACITALGRG